jgi:hypothetical protein
LIDVSVGYVEVTLTGDWLLNRDPEEAVEDQELTMDDVFGDEEDNYPEYVRIPLEDRKSRYFQKRTSRDMLTDSTLPLALQMPFLRWMKLRMLCVRVTP